jgi:hypothetical protein
MEQSPSWEANLFAVSQEIPRILWNPKAHYHIHNCQPPVRILSQLDPVHIPTCYLLKIHLNIILPSTPGSPKWSLSLRVPHQSPVYASPLPPYTLHAPLISFFSIISPVQCWVKTILSILILKLVITLRQLHVLQDPIMCNPELRHASRSTRVDFRVHCFSWFLLNPWKFRKLVVL